MPAAPLLDRRFLERLEQLTIHWQRSFPGLVGGHNLSRFAGSGQEFLDHRNFFHGDDLRGVNWHAYLRLEKLFMKMFQVEPRVPVRLLLDASRSMSTGAETGRWTKFGFAQRVAAALCYVGLVRLDAITLLPFQTGLGEAHQCGGGRHRYAPVSDFLSGLQADGQTNYQRVVREYLMRYPQRGLVMVMSDFLDDADCLTPLQYLGEHGHELLLIHVYAEEDRLPPWQGELQLVDAETGGQLDITFDDEARKQYTAAFDTHAANLQRLALRQQGRYVVLPTSLSLDDAVFQSLARARGVA